MARVKLTEFRAKKLILGETYRGVSLGRDSAIPRIPGPLVLKADQGIKQRFKKGLVAIGIPRTLIASRIKSWKRKRITRFLLEPLIPHRPNEERYLSLERVREGIRILFSKEGGIDVESRQKHVVRFTFTGEKSIPTLVNKMRLPQPFLTHLIKTFEINHFAFLEINPLVVRGSKVFILDAAALVDDAALHVVEGRWGEADIIEVEGMHKAERAVALLSKTTAASLKLKVLNTDGSLFFLLSGGGGSITIADEAANTGVPSLMGNYGEYSGGPTREETYLYAREVISLVLESKAKKKALVIAGGIANFTDIQETFSGVIDALSEKSRMLRKQKIQVFVRRGGPNETQGLSHMRSDLAHEGIMGQVYGSDSPLISAVTDAINFVQK